MPRKKISRNAIRRSYCDTLNMKKRELEFLLKNTRFDQQEIIEFFRYTKKKILCSKLRINKKIFFFRNFNYDCPDGKLRRKKVQNMYEMILPTSSSAAVFADQIFRIFDSDGNGYISFTVSFNMKYCCEVDV